MSVKSVQIATPERKYNRKVVNNNISFGNNANPVIVFMDAMNRGGFMASFIMQDFLGMAGPRVLTGIYRNHDKTGQLNWDFAKKEGIREILSGPSAFIIPAVMLGGIKKFAGSANNVPIDYIKGFGRTFADFAQNTSSDILTDVAKSKHGFYEKVFEKMLSDSTNGGLKGEELNKLSKDFAQRLIDAEKAPKKGFWKHLKGQHVEGSAQDLKHALQEDFVKLRKQYLGASGDKIVTSYNTGEKTIHSSFKSFINHMNDFTNDATKRVKKAIVKTPELPTETISNFVKKLSQRRAGSRFISNMSMFLAVLGFYTLIPKLYNHVTKGRDPGLDGLGVPQQSADLKQKTEDVKKDSEKKTDAGPSFTGIGSLTSKLGRTVADTPGLKKFSNGFEFEGATMPMPAMLTLLFGFCLPPRLKHAQSNTDRKEILLRDITSFLAILFGSKAINRVCSDVFAKFTGLALNIKPENHKESIFKKIWHYIYPDNGVQVLDSDRITAHYSDVANYKDGVNDMFRFIDKNGGNVGKVLNIDKDIQKAATEILGEKPARHMKLADIISKFDNAKGTEAYKKIVNKLADQGNKLVKQAKTCNSAFGFVSTIFLVPALMIWISRHCEKMTKRHIAEQQKIAQQNNAQKNNIPTAAMRAVTSAPTMAGFLNR